MRNIASWFFLIAALNVARISGKEWPASDWSWQTIAWISAYTALGVLAMELHRSKP